MAACFVGAIRALRPSGCRLVSPFEAAAEV
jgi:hypothetical protein